MTQDEINQILEAYADALIRQYINKPKARATIKMFADGFLANGLLWQIEEAFDLSIATGKQLDILGKYIGIDRKFLGFNIKPGQYFAFSVDILEDDNNEAAGFNIDNFNTNTYWLTKDSFDSAGFLLGDEIYRFLLQLKIIKNNTTFTLKNVDDILKASNR